MLVTGDDNRSAVRLGTTKRSAGVAEDDERTKKCKKKSADVRRNLAAGGRRGHGVSTGCGVVVNGKKHNRAAPCTQTNVRERQPCERDGGIFC